MRWLVWIQDVGVVKVSNKWASCLSEDRDGEEDAAKHGFFYASDLRVGFQGCSMFCVDDGDYTSCWDEDKWLGAGPAFASVELLYLIFLM